jgi:hypothetical protein
MNQFNEFAAAQNAIAAQMGETPKWQQINEAATPNRQNATNDLIEAQEEALRRIDNG